MHTCRELVILGDSSRSRNESEQKGQEEEVAEVTGCSLLSFDEINIGLGCWPPLWFG